MYAPEVIQELKEWADEGLIAPFDLMSLYDDVFVEVLRAIRKRLKSDESPRT